MEGRLPLAPMKGRVQPTRDEVVHHARLTVLNHPLVDAQVTLLRDARTPAVPFASAIEEVTRFLLWSALASAATAPVSVPGHSGTPAPGQRIAERVAGLVILRAGLGMVEPVRRLFPAAPIYQLGIRRDEATLQPSVYYTNLPHSYAEIDHLLLLDPMLATGGSAVAAVDIVRQRFRGTLSVLGVIGAPLGVQRLLDADPTVRVFLAALDDYLNDRGFIMPGLGDAGDRIFGTQ